MKIMLTSFGVEDSLSGSITTPTMFHRMPPVSFGRVCEGFLPDYELLLLCDSVVMDEVSFDRLVHTPAAAYTHVADTFRALQAEGRVELRDFSFVLRQHEALLNQMVERDLKSLEQWIAPLRESLALWRDFLSLSRDLIRPESEKQPDLTVPAAYQRPLQLSGLSLLTYHSAVIHNEAMALSRVSDELQLALESSQKRKRKEYRQTLREILRSYLTYVDVNLILSHQMDIGFHDWLDFTPFYNAKFLSVGRESNPVEESRAQLQRLFAVPFPDLAIRDTRTLIKALNDKKVEELRRLVAAAVNGEVQFDNEFAAAVLREVFSDSERARKWRNVVGYAAMPIGFISLVRHIVAERCGGDCRYCH